MWSAADGGVQSGDADDDDDDEFYQGDPPSGGSTPASSGSGPRLGTRKIVFGAASSPSGVSHDDDDDDGHGEEVRYDAAGRKMVLRDGKWRLVMVGAAPPADGRDEHEEHEGSGMTVTRAAGSKGRLMAAAKRVAANVHASHQRNTDDEGDSADGGTPVQRRRAPRSEGQRGVFHALARCCLVVQRCNMQVHNI